jgi:hypothetical protein
MSDKLPFLVALGDRLLVEAGSEAALACFGDAVESIDDSSRMCELGYMLLQRSGASSLPLCERDFQGTYIWFEDEQVFFNAWWIDPEDTPVSFTQPSAILKLAVRAFGNAWMWFNQFDDAPGPSRGDFIRGLYALDGLRVALLELSDFDSVRAVAARYDEWVEDWWRTDIDEYVQPFDGNFRESVAYIKGREDAVKAVSLENTPVLPETLSELRDSQRLVIWQLNQILQNERSRATEPEQIDALAGK